MLLQRQNIPDIMLISPTIHGDARGYFMESFHRDKLEQTLNHPITFIQDNESQSRYGVLRGLHAQASPHAQSKLVRVVQGRILDVAVDIRQGSPSFGNHVAVELSAENKQQLFVPRGFAHGFVVLSEQAIVQYKVDNYYAPEHDMGISALDESLSIDWHIPQREMLLSEKDKQLPCLKNFISPFHYHDNYYG